MTLKAIIDLMIENYVYTIIIAIIFVYFIRRTYKTMQMYLNAKSYVKDAIKLDRKKFNGMILCDKIKRKRKRNTNNFRQLRARARNKVRAYFEHKIEELPVMVSYSRSKMFKRSRDNFMIVLKDNGKTVKKIKMKKALKAFIELTNDYECLNEFIIFLHHLPDAILDNQEYDTLVGYEDLQLTYIIK